MTELITGVDLVKSQIRIAMGMNLHEAPIDLPRQEQLTYRGVALQSRITSEDPANGFTPDYGRITSYRSPAGYGVRLDGGTAYSVPRVITPYFDSLLVKLTCFGSTFDEVISRTQRALAEFRIRGVKTNIPFLQNLVAHPDFQSGHVSTTFIDSTPSLFKFPQRRDRATKLLTYIGDVIVNGRPEIKNKPDITVMTPPPVLAFDHAADGEPPEGTRDVLKRLGAKKFADWTLKQKRLLITDTTMRDAHQSLLATRVRTVDMLASAGFVSAAAAATAFFAGDVGRGDI